MLIYIINVNERFSAAELAQMAIEGGCEWLDIDMPELSDEQMRETLAGEVLQMCREAGIILTITDRPELARELGLHGVRFSASYFLTHPAETPMSLRNSLGPEAIIGIETSDASASGALETADIDFVCTPPSLDTAARRSFVEALRAAGCSLPIVAQGDFGADCAAALLAEGFNGLAVGKAISQAEDPAEAVGQILRTLKTLE